MEFDPETKKSWKRSPKRKDRRMMNSPDDIEGKVFDGLPPATPCPTDGDSQGEPVSLISAIVCAAIITIILLLIFFWPGTTCHAAEIRKDRAVNAIIGEAEGECQQGKLAVACAIRNRGTLKGVYGEHAPRVRKHKYSPKTFVAAVKAWEESSHPENCEFINGADGWGNNNDVKQFKKNQWWKRVAYTTKIGNHIFYR